MGWRVAPACKKVLDEANQLYPRRSKASDGTIGDAAHASRTSHHNPHPEGGWVDAVDLTHDPANGCDAHAWARGVAARKDPRVEYLISNGQICRGYDKPGIPAWTWTKYTGSNPHTKHAHLSIWRRDSARSDTRSWFRPPPVMGPVALEEDDMMTQYLFAEQLYQTYCSRPADEKGLSYWVGRCRAPENQLPGGGVNADKVRDEFVGLAKFGKTYNPRT